jgi:2,5-diketo-D-gluconate reductase A
MTVPNVPLNNGVEIPQVGFGVWRIPADETKAAVTEALQAGYRHIDTAKLYRNEEAVGAAVRESGLDRDAVFVTTKVWNSDHGYDPTLRAFDASMRRLGLDVLDLYLIHWPRPAEGTAAETWRALERLYLDGRVRAIGVSNFEPDHLRRLLDKSEVVPVVNQVELHPYFPQAELRAFHDEHDIRTESWSPLAKRTELLQEPVITAIAAEHGVSPAQVVLRWHVELEAIPIPKSADAARRRENFDIFSFTLSNDEVEAISALSRGRLWGADPDSHEEF